MDNVEQTDIKHKKRETENAGRERTEAPFGEDVNRWRQV